MATQGTQQDARYLFILFLAALHLQPYTIGARSNILDSPDYSMAANDATIVSKTCIIQFLDFGE